MDIFVENNEKLACQAMEFEIGQSFPNYDSLCDFVKRWEDSHHTQLYKRTSKKCDSDMRYSRLVFCCKAGGRAFKSCAKKRETK